MPHTLNLGTTTTTPSPTFCGLLAEMSRTTDPEKLQRLHRIVCCELANRLSQQGTCHNPHLRDVSDEELLGIINKVVASILGILSRERAVRCEAQYVARYSIGVYGIYLPSCRDMYKALAERLEPDEELRAARFYQSEDEIVDIEREANDPQDDSLEHPYQDPSYDEE